MLATGLSWRGEGSSAHGGTNPSRITLQLMKAPERDTLSLRGPLTHFAPSPPWGSPISGPIRIKPSDPRDRGGWAAIGVFFSLSVDGAG